MNITVMGSGSFGCALAIMLDKHGHNVKIWSFRESEAAAIKEHRENKEFLPGARIEESIGITTDIAEALSGAEVVIVAVPSKFMRANIESFKPHIAPGQIIVDASKGIEDGTLKPMGEVIEEILPENPVAILAGPSHAEEVSRGMPAAVVIAARDEALAKKLQNVFANADFRVYTTTDVISVELGGALKNVVALGAGISDGLGFGDNAKAALITRGIVEMARLGMAMGGSLETFFGLSGIGDMIATCTSRHSRNRRAGILLGQGKSLKETLAEVHMVVEGVSSAKAAWALAQKYNVYMPITEAINKILFEGLDPKEACLRLMKAKVRKEAIEGNES
ncbi:MAG: NAD(P)H-dependent glycerol-3-phosphate dehydrogenase [Firmicutes bacterium]|nr:NAD(P)H-dependent glycerol-3-phosphate dehydrogenase [Bacillota bacterium]